jgi:putative zinc finger/helix-turn-helix YgiT family protein
MKSPINGNEMILTHEKRSLEFRKEKFEVVFQHYFCETSKEYFTTTSLDDVNTNQVYNQYRDKHNIPFPDEIAKIRAKYELSASRMAEILGFGINSYRQYEAGEMPSVSNARLIQMINDPEKFREMVVLCDSLEESTKLKYIKVIQNLLDKKQTSITSFKEYILGSQLADIYSGYRNPNFEKFAEMVVFFSEKLEPYKTKMNKLLFYADFLMFKNSCFSISGLRYIAIDMGPVPNNFQSIFEFLANNDTIDIFNTQFSQGYIGEQFKARIDRPFNANLLTVTEIGILNKVAERFKLSSTNEIIAFSHLEEAWKQNQTGKNKISYQYAFDLNQI